MEHLTEFVTRLVFQLAIILIAAKLAGEICERYLKTPAVLGELVAGILIGPFALGGFEVAGIGPLFEHVVGGHSESVVIPVSQTLWSIAQVGVIVLLFVAGIETDLKLFLRYARPASIVAVGGVVFPFILGDVLTVTFGFADGFTDVRALFVGAVLTATSIGITVRVLEDLGSLSTPEGVTILGAAVLDDVIGILILTVVVGIGKDVDFSYASVGLVALKALGFWIVLTGVGLLASKHIARFLMGFKVSGSTLALSLSLALMAAGLAESFGLAMIIGAFSMGLALSGTDLAESIDKPLKSVYAALAPVFFVVMGMSVNVADLGGVWLFGLVITFFAVIGKVVGGGLPAMFVGFNRKGSWRIGIGLLPRGEVALVLAGIGLSEGILGADLYTVSIMMSIITTLIAPPVLAASFRRGGSGVRAESDVRGV